MLRTELIEQGKRTRAAILEAAAVEFGNSGYDAASLSDIGARAGKDKAALRHHFATKADLAVGVDDHQYSVWLPMVQAVERTGTRGLPALLALLSEAIDDSVTLPFARAVIRLRVDGHPPEVQLSPPLFSWMAIIEARVVEAVDDGEIPADSDPTSTARLLIDSSFGVHQLNAVPLDSASAAERFANHWRHILIGVGARDPDGVLAAARATREKLHSD
jgi:AcrR family transcriptional regulator